MSKIKKLAITGANGFLGKHTIRSAVSKGWEVVGVVRREAAAKEIELIGATAFIVEEFNVEKLRIAFKDCKAIIHFANVVCGSKEIFERVNIKGTEKVVLAAAKERVERIIYPSGLGLSEYGKAEWASNNYFWSKMRAEQVIRDSKVNYVIFRPSYILGPKDELIPELVDQIYAGRVFVAGNGEYPMQPVYVQDAVKAFLAAADGIGENNVIYDLVGPKIINMVDFIKSMHDVSKKLGYNMPFPLIENVPLEEAPKVLGICKEMVDVMFSDITSDGSIVSKALGYQLSPIEVAMEAAIIEKLRPKIVLPKKSAIILLSGGIDSTTAMFWAIKQGYNLIALTFNYLYRSKQEKLATSKLAKLAGVELIEIPVNFLKEALELRFEGFPIPSVINAPEGYIPSRNLIFYSIAAFYSEAYDINVIIGGHHAEDKNIFPDSSTMYFNALKKVLKMGKLRSSEQSIEFLFPLVKLRKEEVLKMAVSLKVPLELTWSCYSDEENHCERCKSCLDRKEAFNKIGLIDPFPNHHSIKEKK